MKNTHGGAGRGQGRKRIYTEKMKGKTMHMTEAHWELLSELGGSHWLRIKLEDVARTKGLSI